MRTIVNLPVEQIEALDRYAKAHGDSRTEVVRKAVAAFLPRTPGKGRFQDHPAFGSMKKKVDAVEYIRKLRSEWEQ